MFAGGDVLALLLFSTIGRYSHGLSIFDFDTLHTADPFIAGMFGFLDCETYVFEIKVLRSRIAILDFVNTCK